MGVAGSSSVSNGVIKFLGASTVAFEEQANWESGSSTFSVTLVEDITNGDSFTSGIVGAPYTFYHGSGHFTGLLQRQVTKKSTAGFTYQVDLVSPNDLLTGTQVILNSYANPISGIANVFNVYGYYETTRGFNGAQANAAGMYWNAQAVSLSGNPFGSGTLTLVSGNYYGIKPGIEYIQSNPGIWGSGILYKGYNYTVNFSGLPKTAPSYYRIGGQNSIVTISDCIGQLCNDAGVDWIVTMQSGTTTIDFKTLSRTNALPLSAMQSFIASKSGLVVSSEIGVENVNENTNLFIIGGNQQVLMEQSVATDSTSILPFFGLDLNGFPSIGTGDEDTYTVTVTAIPISDIIGSYNYTIDMKEMRFALASEDLWAAYLFVKNPTLARALGIPSVFSIDDGAQANLLTQQFAHDFISQNTSAAYAWAQLYDNATWVNNFYRLFTFVRTIAMEYYGRRFLVKTPVFIQGGVEAETNRVVYSYDVVDGGITTGGLPPLSLSQSKAAYFTNPDNTYTHLVRIPNANSGDFTSLGNSPFVIQNTNCYLPCRVLSEYGVLYNGTFGAAPSYIVIELDTPLYRVAYDGLGGVDQLNVIYGVNITTAEQVRNMAFAGVYHPAPMFPDAVAIALRSNQYTYGPWFTTSGPAGRVEIRQDASLTPWNYGGYNVMNAVAQAELNNFASNLQVIETGNIQVAESPSLSIGDALVSSGPIVTDIQARQGADGIVTTYNMRTYTPRKGQFLREQIRRLQVVSQAAVQLGRTLQQRFRNF